MPTKPNPNPKSSEAWNALDNAWSTLNELHQKMDDGEISDEDIEFWIEQDGLAQFVEVMEEASSWARDILEIYHSK